MLLPVQSKKTKISPRIAQRVAVFKVVEKPRGVRGVTRWSQRMGWDLAIYQKLGAPNAFIETGKEGALGNGSCFAGVAWA